MKIIEEERREEGLSPGWGESLPSFLPNAFGSAML
jgi:hypothetical protein